MSRGVLFFINIGLVLIMFSAFGNGNMEINYSLFVPGIIIVVIGLLWFFYLKKNKGKEK